MKLNSNPFTLLLGIIMLILGIGNFLGYSLFPILQGNTNLTYVAIAIGVLLALLVFTGKIKETVGTLVICLWIGLMAIVIFFTGSFTYSDLIIMALPFASGAFLIIGL
jgi:hypothetical protein